MPNGRHGAVLIPREAVKQFLASIPGDPVIAVPDGKEVTLSDVMRLAERHPDAEVLVEMQHLDPGIAVVLHFPQWVWVTEDCDVFEDFKQFWLEWLGRS